MLGKKDLVKLAAVLGIVVLAALMTVTYLQIPLSSVQPGAGEEVEEKAAAANESEAIAQSASLGVTMPSDFSLSGGGPSVSLEEAMRLASNTGFALELPTNIPAGLKLVDIKVTGVGPEAPGPSTPTLGTVVLFYAYEPLPANADLPYLLNSGGLSILENKRPDWFDQEVNSFQGKTGPNEPAIGVTIDGKPAIYVRNSTILPWTTQLKWADKEVKIHIEAGPTHFPQDELIAFAASFK